MMLRFIRLINQNCRGAARLISDARERPLSPAERAGLRIHLLGCRSCRRYRDQIDIIEKCMTLGTAEPALLSASARKRIGQRLSE